MKNTISLLFPRLLIGVFFFCFLNVKSQKNANNNIQVSEDSINIKKRTQKTVDYFNEIVFNTEFDGKWENAFKWNKNRHNYKLFT